MDGQVCAEQTVDPQVGCLLPVPPHQIHALTARSVSRQPLSPSASSGPGESNEVPPQHSLGQDAK